MQPTSSPAGRARAGAAARTGDPEGSWCRRDCAGGYEVFFSRRPSSRRCDSRATVQDLFSQLAFLFCCSTDCGTTPFVWRLRRRRLSLRQLLLLDRLRLSGRRLRRRRPRHACPLVSSLKALADLPSERAISGSFLAPKSRMITPAMISSSGTPRLPTVFLLSPPAVRWYVSRSVLHPCPGLPNRHPQRGQPRPEGAGLVPEVRTSGIRGPVETPNMPPHPNQHGHEHQQPHDDHDQGRQVRHHGFYRSGRVMGVGCPGSLLHRNHTSADRWLMGSGAAAGGDGTGAPAKAAPPAWAKTATGMQAGRQHEGGQTSRRASRQKGTPAAGRPAAAGEGDSHPGRHDR